MRGILCGVLGSLTGGIVGALVGTDKIIQIEGRSSEEIKVVLEKLCGKARMSDYKGG